MTESLCPCVWACVIDESQRWQSVVERLKTRVLMCDNWYRGIVDIKRVPSLRLWVGHVAWYIGQYNRVCGIPWHSFPCSSCQTVWDVNLPNTGCDVHTWACRPRVPTQASIWTQIVAKRMTKPQLNYLIFILIFSTHFLHSQYLIAVL
jgi:hypothetical protein